MIKTNGLFASHPSRAFACLRAFSQSLLESSNATATSLLSGNPAIRAPLKTPELTPLATDKYGVKIAPKRFAQPGFAFAS